MNLIATAVLVFNLITGYTNPADCPTGAVWQWYPEHAIWACGGER